MQIDLLIAVCGTFVFVAKLVGKNSSDL